jgi:hypothetical protein
MNTLLFLTCMLAITPQVYDKPSTKVDIIEINHFWQQQDSLRRLDDKEVAYGRLIFDQVVLWRLDESINKYRIVQWELIKDGRIRLEIPEGLTDEEKAQIKKDYEQKQWDEWAGYHRTFAKFNKVSPEDIVVYIDEQWIGPKSWKHKPVYSESAKHYEMYMSNDMRILAKSLVESHTTYDPDVSYRNEFNVRPGDTKLLNSFQPYFDRKYKK